ncbi:Zn-ribbon containing protein [Halobacteria archaeon AArc-dxtr1]|nr:Zn-ribbon containing protein [Halobacteria archaeon AArc-dxtr1]
MPHQCTNCGRTFPDGSKEMLSGCPDCGGNRFQFAPATDEGDGAGTSGETEATSDAGTTGDAVADSAPATNADAPTSTGGQTDRSPSDGSPADVFDEWPETARRPAHRSPPDESGASADGARSADGESAPSEPSTTDDSGMNGFTEPATEKFADAPSSASTQDAPSSEDTAQASARSDVVSNEELPPVEAASDSPPTSGPDAPDDGRVVSEPEDDQPSLDDLREELNQQFESIKIVNPGQYELNLMELYNRDEYIISLQEDGRYVIDVPESWHATDE